MSTQATAASATQDSQTSSSTTSSTEGQTSTADKTASSATTSTSDASVQTTGQTTGSTDAAQTGDLAPWQDSLPDGLKTDPLFRTYKDVGELAKAHQHLTKLKGATAAELLKIPSKPQDQAPEDWAPIHKALGVPDDPKDYQITLAPEAAADTPELEGILRELGGKAKFQPAQMNAVIETLNELGKKGAEAQVEALKTESAAVKAELQKDWGAAYEGNTRAIGKLIRDAMGGTIDEAAQADLETKLGANATISRVLAYAIGKMAEPDRPEGGGGQPATKQMTPTEATAALNAFYADKEKMAALNDRKHPQHAAVLKERGDILTMQRGEKRPDQVN